MKSFIVLPCGYGVFYLFFFSSSGFFFIFYRFLAPLDLYMTRHCHGKPERPQEGMVFWVNSGQFWKFVSGKTSSSMDFMHKNIKLVVISPIKIDQSNRAGKSVISVVERPERVYRKNYCEKFEDISWFCDLFIFNFIYKTIHWQHLKGMHRSKLGTWKRYHLSMEGIRRVTFNSVKNGIWKAHGVGP